ncbi:MAG: tetratricopeptide repeat protein [Aquificae bacterium]|nr:tetratricopeptide repeat protein [Aquificota bacterium]
MIHTVLLILIISLVTCGYSKTPKNSLHLNQNINNLNQIKDQELLKLMLHSFLYSNNLQGAYKVSKYALELFPDSIFWLEKTAQIALWIGKYQEALFYFKKLYSKTKDKKLEDTILRLSMQLYEYDTSLKILEKRLLNGKLEYLNDYIYVVKITGEYQRGYNTLKKIKEKYKYEDEILLRTLYQLGKSLGKKESIKYLEKLITKPLANQYDYMELAQIYLYKREFKKALEVLNLGIKRLGKNEEFYKLASDIAWGLGEKHKAYKYSLELVKLKRERLVDYIRIVDYFYTEKKDFNKALTFIEKALKKYKNLYLAKTYIYIHIQNKNWKKIAKFLQTVDKDIYHKLLQDSYITYVYAHSLEKIGEYQKAITIYEKTLQSSFSIERLKSLLVLLIDLQQAKKLEYYLRKYKDIAQKNPNLWYVYSLGYLVLQDTQKAKYYLSKILKKEKDITVYLLYADLLEISGETQRAKYIKYKVWKKIKDTTPKTKEDAENYLRTAMYFAPPSKFRKLLERYKNLLNPQTYWNIRYSFLFKIEAQDKVYYLSQKYNHLKNWMKMNIALFYDDRDKQLKLIEKDFKTVPIRDRIEAAVRTGQIGLAKKLAFLGLEENPRDYLLYKWLRDLYMIYSGKFEIKAEYSSRLTVNQGIINYLYKYPLKNRDYLFIKGNFTAQESSDRNRYINVPSTDSRIDFSIKHLLDRGEFVYSFGFRKALDSFVYTKAKITYYTKDKVTISPQVYINEYADESIYLMLGGMKTGIKVDVEYLINNRTFLNVILDSSRFYSQDRTYIGYGNMIESQIYHKLRVSYPDFSFRGYTVAGIYSEKEGYKGIIENLSPIPNPVILPENFVEIGGEFSFGYDNRYLYTRTVRPFLKVGISYNTVTYFGYSGELGIGGVLTKSDNLDIGITLFRGFTGVLDQYVNLYVEYRKWF